MGAIEIIKDMKKDIKPYKRTLILLKKYRDLKHGEEIIGNKREVVEILNKVMNFIKDDPYYEVIDLYYVKGCSMEDTAMKMNIDITTAYKNKERLVKRISVILYGDEALL